MCGTSTCRGFPCCVEGIDLDPPRLGCAIPVPRTHACFGPRCHRAGFQQLWAVRLAVSGVTKSFCNERSGWWAGTIRCYCAQVSRESERHCANQSCAVRCGRKTISQNIFEAVENLLYKLETFLGIGLPSASVTAMGSEHKRLQALAPESPTCEVQCCRRYCSDPRSGSPTFGSALDLE